MSARRAGVVAVCLVVLAVGVSALTLPALPDVHPRVGALRKDLIETHDKLAIERAKLIGDHNDFERSVCGRVEKGSAAASRCRKELEGLDRRSLDHCRSSVAFIKQYQLAIGPAIASAPQERPALIAQLKGLQGQFEKQVQSFDSWAEDTRHAQELAQRKLDEVVMASALNVMMSLSEEQLVKRVDGMIERASAAKNVKWGKRSELSFLTVSLRGELKGKTPAQAKAIILGALNAQRRSVGDMAKVADAAIGGMSRQVNAGAEESDQAMFDGAYNAVILGAKLTIAHAPELVKTLGRAEAALGVMALAPDFTEMALFVAEGFVDESNIDAMDSLRQAAEKQRVAVSARLTSTFKDPQVLKDLQVSLRASAQFQCSK
jgi:hypothetical protein